MKWLFGARRLRAQGVLGMNQRNAMGILEQNPRSLFPIVDDKLCLDALCQRLRLATPLIHAVIEHQGQLQQLPTFLARWTEIVIKPARGAGGRGILILESTNEGRYRRPNGQYMTLREIRYHLGEVLAGMFSLGNGPDRVIFQQRVGLHPAFTRISPKGIPDIRIILYRFEPVMAMLRLPTLLSNGRANLHQGGIGVGVDLLTGLTHHAIHAGCTITHHPDTGSPLRECQIPCWNEILHCSRVIARAVGLGYLGTDMVIDPIHGPLMLEVNARPGLAIQLANNAGLLHRMAEVDQSLDS